MRRVLLRSAVAEGCRMNVRVVLAILLGMAGTAALVPAAEPSAAERGRKALPGRGNGGHPFGDKLSEDERRAVIEYLKTIRATFQRITE
jgi:mono/diheme cytochrome c family protein